MHKKWQSFCERIEKERLFVGTSLAGMVLALGFWGVAFPQYLFTGDCIKIVDEEGNNVTDKEREEENLYRRISTAKPEQIEVKVSILEWAKR